MAALKLKGYWERRVWFDWPAMAAPTVARPPAGPTLVAVNPPALLLPVYINKNKTANDSIDRYFCPQNPLKNSGGEFERLKEALLTTAKCI